MIGRGALALTVFALGCAPGTAQDALVPYTVVGDAIPKSLTGKPGDPENGRVFYSAENGPAADSARRTEIFRDFLAFSQFPIWTGRPVSTSDGTVLVEVRDMRFGRHGPGGFTASALVDAQMRVVRAWFQFL